MQNGRLVILLFALFSSFSVKAQLYQLFFFENEMLMQYDLESQKRGYQAMDYFWKQDYDSAVYHMNILKCDYPEHTALLFNWSMTQARLGNAKEVRKGLKKWLTLKDSNAVCSCFQNAPHLDTYQKKKWFLKLEKECWESKAELQSISNVQLSDKIMYYLLVDQSIVGNHAFLNGKNQEREDSLLRKNLEQVKQYVDFDKLPNKKEIGKFACSALQKIVIHIDYDPGFQVDIGESMLSIPESYSQFWSAMIVDRGLKNMGQPQRFGTVKEYDSYQGGKSAVNDRRAEIGLKKIED